MVCWRVDLFFAQILTMDIKRLPQRESLVHHRQLIYQLKFSFQKVSVHRNEQNGQEEYIRIVTVNNMGCGRSLFAKENLFIINN